MILFIGDGMGQNAISATRYIIYGADGLLNMERLPYQCRVKTYAKNSLITDSGAAGTGMATGEKTNVRMISVKSDGKTAAPTIAELAKKDGYACGIITTMRISHATPATFIAHSGSRSFEEDIAVQAINFKPNVLFGGGLNFLIPAKDGGKRTDELNLINIAVDSGFTIVKERKELLAIPDTVKYVLGIFAKEHMRYELERDTTYEPSLTEMVSVALKILPKASKKGFFLMVEAGNIDYAAHANDFVNLVGDVFELDKAVKVAIEFAKKNKNTLLIVTADHETGGFALIGFDNGENVKVYGEENEYLFPQVPKEISNVREIITNSGIVAGWASNPEALRKGRLGEHTPSDVWLGAMGPNAELFNGVIENTYIFT
ncbi:MAG: alkaline phosphatase, partial [bacterium]